MKTLFRNVRWETRRVITHLLCPIVLILISCSSDDTTTGPEAKRLPEGPAEVYVDSAAGDDANAGSINLPVATITRAIELCATYGGDVHVAEGTYVEPCTLLSNINLWGGYSAAFERDPEVYVTVIGQGPGAVFGNGADSVTIDGFVIVSGEVTGSPTTSSIPIHLHDCSGVVLSNNIITAGSVLGSVAGANGGAGTPGGDGEAGGWGSVGAGGTSGGGGYSPVGGCFGGDGGAGGTADGEAGLDGGCWGGAGGEAGIYYEDYTEPAGDGTNGAEGSVGTDGENGEVFGTVSQYGYYPSNGWLGTDGTAGTGGGGGGGGGGDLTNGGGGGGGGGGAGQGGGTGDGGMGGGASIGILITGTTTLDAAYNEITTGDGADGGDGGIGGVGGNGGSGGPRGWGTAGFPGMAGVGGDGGAGGRGGHGGAGGGGPSIGIYIGPGAALTNTANTFNIGSPGTGGTSGGGVKAPDGLTGEILPTAAAVSGRRADLQDA
jgi:hypothetical protein